MTMSGPEGQIWSQLPPIGLTGNRIMVTPSHFGLVLVLFCALRDPNRAHFGPKSPFWGFRTILFVFSHNPSFLGIKEILSFKR